MTDMKEAYEQQIMQARVQISDRDEIIAQLKYVLAPSFNFNNYTGSKLLC